MSQASHKSRNAHSLSLNPAKPSAKTKSERNSIDDAESNQKAKDVVVKDTKDNSKLNNDEKHSAKKDKTSVVEDDIKAEKNTSKNDDKVKNGSSNNSDESNTKISNGSHKIEENVSATEEKKTRETRHKTTAAKDNKLENAETTNDSKSEKNDKSSEKIAASNKDKEKEMDKDKEKDKDMKKSNQKDKKHDKEDKPPTNKDKDTPKKDTKDAKSTAQTVSPKDKESKDVSKSRNADSPKPKSMPESTPTKLKKIEEKSEEATPAAPKEDKQPKQLDLIVSSDNEEMEPLVMQMDIDERTPPKKLIPTTSTPTPNSRILRMRSGAPERNDSPLSLNTIVDPKNNTSTCVNLSTLTNPHSADKSYGFKVRSVSGRRPMLREISYHNSYREYASRQNDSYSPNVINESASSGYLDQSQRSVNTSSFVARKRYNEDHIVEEIESPKRRRLDISGLLTLVTSPVTMLRNRLERARIQSSTPNSKLNINKDDIEIDTVTASCIDEQPKDLEANEEEQYGIHENDEDMKELPDDFNNIPEDGEFPTDIQIKILKDENKLESSPFVPNDVIKRKWSCSLM